MKILDLISTAVHNTFRSKLRTVLTVLAIVIGAFTLTLTNGIGTGINQYLNNQVSAMGKNDVLIVQKSNKQQAATSGPAKYDGSQSTNTAINGATSAGFTQKDIEAIKTISGVSAVNPMLNVNPSYIQYGDHDKYQLSIQGVAGYTNSKMLSGSQVEESSALAIQIPQSYIKALGFNDDQDVVGKEVKIAVQDVMMQEHTLNVKITGVTAKSLLGESIGTNSATMRELSNLQQTGIPVGAPQNYVAVNVTIADATNEQNVADIKKAFADKGYDAQTISDRLGNMKTVINGIVWALNGFAAIALLAASFGIINTLLMSVQERTREIGLMKALGMGSKKIFGLFSLEAAFIGFLGSVIGSALAIGVGYAVSSYLAGSVLKDLPGLEIIAFTPQSVVAVISGIMLIAFLAGTLPALRASRLHPIQALKYE